MADIKWMDLNEFLNEGYLQEVNRQFFHPLGLALSVTCDEDGNVTDIWGLWDYRDDPEGMIFGDTMDAEKAAKVAAERERHREVRIGMFTPNSAPRHQTDVQPLNWKPDDGPSRDE